jgi:hypothetical protein
MPAKCKREVVQGKRLGVSISIRHVTYLISGQWMNQDTTKLDVSESKDRVGGFAPEISMILTNIRE